MIRFYLWRVIKFILKEAIDPSLTVGRLFNISSLFNWLLMFCFVWFRFSSLLLNWLDILFSLRFWRNIRLEVRVYTSLSWKIAYCTNCWVSLDSKYISLFLSISSLIFFVRLWCEVRAACSNSLLLTKWALFRLLLYLLEKPLAEDFDFFSFSIFIQLYWIPFTLLNENYLLLNLKCEDLFFHN